VSTRDDPILETVTGPYPEACQRLTWWAGKVRERGIQDVYGVYLERSGVTVREPGAAVYWVRLGRHGTGQESR
jgi:hypothetical protein